MKIKYSNFLLLCFLILAAIVFIIYVNDSYYTDNNGVSLGADSAVYYNAASNWDFDNVPLVALNYNYLGPVLVLLASGLSNFFVFLINAFLFVVAYFCLVNTYRVDRSKFLVLLAMNPMLIASLLLVNKEVLGLFSVAMFACYLESKKWKFLLMAFVFAFITRWQEMLVMLIYLFVVSGINPFKNNRYATFVAIVIAITLAYPAFLSPIFSVIVAEGTMESQANVAGGMIGMLNTLQDNYLFFVAVFPKILSNTFGNVFRLIDYFVAPASMDYSDVYNSFIVLGHQISMFVLVLFLLKERKINMRSEVVYFSMIYLVLFSISLMIQYRYIFPLYILLCLEATNYSSHRFNQLTQRTSSG